MCNVDYAGPNNTAWHTNMRHRGDDIYFSIVQLFSNADQKLCEKTT